MLTTDVTKTPRTSVDVERPVVSDFNRRFNTEKNIEASSKTTHTFQRFLDTKAKEGFGIKDWFQERFVWAHELKSARKYFFALLTYIFTGGFIGHQMADKNRVNNPVEFQRLKAETEFYRLATKTQNVYNTFKKTPTTVNYQEASEVFEDLHALLSFDGLQAPETHQKINAILNKLVGADVAKGLLEHFATHELTRGGFTSFDLFNFYRGPTYQETLMDKARKGYGAPGINENGTVSNDSNTIRMVFAQTFRNLLDSNKGSHYTTYDTLLTSLRKKITLAEVDQQIESMNQELVLVMKSGEIRQNLVNFVSEDEQKALIVAYKTYIDSVEECNNMKTSLDKRKQELEQKNTELVNVLNTSYAISYQELKPLLTSQNGTSTPTGFEDFISMQGDDKRIQAIIDNLDTDIKNMNTTIKQQNETIFTAKKAELSISNEILKANQDKATSVLKAELEKRTEEQRQLLARTIQVKGTDILNAQFKTVPGTQLAKTVNVLVGQCEYVQKLDEEGAADSTKLRQRKEIRVSSLLTLKNLGFNPVDQSMKYAKLTTQEKEVRKVVKKHLLNVRSTTHYYLNSAHNDTLSPGLKAFAHPVKMATTVSSKGIQTFIPKSDFAKKNENNVDFAEAAYWEAEIAVSKLLKAKPFPTYEGILEDTQIGDNEENNNIVDLTDLDLDD